MNQKRKFCKCKVNSLIQRMLLLWVIRQLERFSKIHQPRYLPALRFQLKHQGLAHHRMPRWQLHSYQHLRLLRCLLHRHQRSHHLEHLCDCVSSALHHQLKIRLALLFQRLHHLVHLCDCVPSALHHLN